MPGEKVVRELFKCPHRPQPHPCDRTGGRRFARAEEISPESGKILRRNPLDSQKVERRETGSYERRKFTRELSASGTLPVRCARRARRHGRCARRGLKAPTISGKPSVQSWPLRVNSRTRADPRYAVLSFSRSGMGESETRKMRGATMADFSAERPCRILSLDGGGAKGFYTLGVLREIEGMAKRPLHEQFDLIFGTSTGAIIAALSALGKSVKEISDLYEKHVNAASSSRFLAAQQPRGRSRRARSRLSGCGALACSRAVRLRPTPIPRSAMRRSQSPCRNWVGSSAGMCRSIFATAWGMPRTSANTPRNWLRSPLMSSWLPALQPWHHCCRPNGGLIVMPESFLNTHRVEITSLAARYRLPAVYAFRFFTEFGGLLSYGNDFIDNYRRAATYVDRILKGEKPADLPVQAPTKYELVINLKTAKALGLEIPSSVLARADEVIE
jgi:Patatin-like phospholipase/ABC transporter substrate binding protein